LKFDLVVAIFPNLVANDYKSHVVVNGLFTLWLISTSDLLLFVISLSIVVVYPKFVVICRKSVYCCLP
jgi:hypothetical protein